MQPNPETHPAPNRLARWAVWAIPVLFLLWLYREGLRTWFSMDDFAWLSLLNLVKTRHDLLHELFAPAAQGTIRPWSERGFFLLMEWLFGLNSIPYRIVVFATAVASVLLLTWITIRITGSRIAGLAAPILWIANSSLFIPMTWTSAYNEVMCSAFLLGALALFIRYAETGSRKFWWCQLIVFVTGFGALEINVVYPALAAAWILFTVPRRDNRGRTNDEYSILSREGNRAVGPQRDHRTLSTPTLLRSEIPLAAISVVYFLIHRAVAPLQTSGAYVLHFNKLILRSIAIYLQWSLIPESADRAGRSHHGMQLALAIQTAAIVAFIIAQWKRNYGPICFYLTWFVIPLAPLLPLTEHRTIYYVMIPVMGLAMLGAEAVARYWNASPPKRMMLATALIAYFWAMIPTDRSATHWWYEETQTIRAVYLGAVSAHETHPGKAIVLDGLRPDIYQLALTHVQFNAGQLKDVYLTPESSKAIDIAAADPQVHREKLDTLVLPQEVIWHGITHDDVVVYSPESDRLRNITEGYTRQIERRKVGRFPSRIDAGDFLYSWLLGPTWLPPESGVRWMPGSATVRVGVPPGGTVLELEGECPQAQLLVAPRHLMVLADGNLVGDTRIYDPESAFRRLFPIPVALLAGKDSVEIEIRVDPVHRIDGQDYGVLFGKIAIGPLKG